MQRPAQRAGGALAVERGCLLLRVPGEAPHGVHGRPPPVQRLDPGEARIEALDRRGPAVTPRCLARDAAESGAALDAERGTARCAGRCTAYLCS